LYWIDTNGLEAITPTVPGVPGIPLIIPPVAISGTPEHQSWVEMATNAINGFPAFEIKCIGAKCFPVPVQNEDASQNEKRPKNCPAGTQDIDKAKKKFGWDKDTLHGIKDSAHGGMGTGKSWTGIAPDGTVGINEGGEWSPQGHWEDLL
jgi:hypothetical protein